MGNKKVNKFIIGISSSPRKKGNSASLLRYVLEKLGEKAQLSTKIIFPYELSFKPCVESRDCIQTGKCRFNDDLDDIYPFLAKAEAVLISTPVFFYGFPGKTKSFIDRAQPYYVRKYLLKSNVPPDGVGGVIALGESKGERLFQGIELTSKYFLDALNDELEATIFLRNFSEKYGSLGESAELKELLDDFSRKLIESIESK